MSQTPFYPIFLDLQDQPVLVVGAGAVALRKVHGLLEARAQVTVISPEFAENFAAIGSIEPITAPYDSGMMKRKPWRLVFAATHDIATNAQVCRDAAAARIPCCRADELEHSDFTNGATARLGPITLAVSTHGASPTLARRIRDAAEQAIDPVLVALAELSASWREQVKKKVPDIQVRAALLQKLAGLEVEQVLRSHGRAAAESLFASWLAQAAPSSPVDHV
jgi:siroheme synthase-like protein